MIALEAGLPCSGGFCVLGGEVGAARRVYKRKVQHVAKISCRNGIEGECWEEKGKFRKDLFNMLHNILYNNINIG